MKKQTRNIGIALIVLILIMTFTLTLSACNKTDEDGFSAYMLNEDVNYAEKAFVDVAASNASEALTEFAETSDSMPANLLMSFDGELTIEAVNDSATPSANDIDLTLTPTMSLLLAPTADGSYTLNFSFAESQSEIFFDVDYFDGNVYIDYGFEDATGKISFNLQSILDEKQAAIDETLADLYVENEQTPDDDLSGLADDYVEERIQGILDFDFLKNLDVEVFEEETVKVAVCDEGNLHHVKVTLDGNFVEDVISSLVSVFFVSDESVANANENPEDYPNGPTSTFGTIIKSIVHSFFTFNDFTLYATYNSGHRVAMGLDLDMQLSLTPSGLAEMASSTIGLNLPNIINSILSLPTGIADSVTSFFELDRFTFGADVSFGLRYTDSVPVRPNNTDAYTACDLATLESLLTAD